MRDCKENLLERIIRTLVVRLLGPLVGDVKVESERIFLKEIAYSLSGEAIMDIINFKEKKH